ncbi:hypothetical protein TBLA_0B05460 [Henningerozyma blattae CBS 6284]|uniref:F-actin-capping protein subunit alpha n=1 Tax=Henningerozyma blattae (strain ATCC 34711 / CBS 6284 / DSM 70876 / NBRC 10599 / NRRL Y-10934 / UCD 77-7) TaxID=1071380 RepID=I2GZ23_HENB6|nr:hypothetical protein TBLA_0B05460 [Tetrapisispora blattae CBS 6284]CCH59375.1 hypothetical protein TBLA_0B05460 [Tetrapisispora blattae CBS 6284]
MSKFSTIISQIIEDSPAGEIKEVYDDLIKITGEDSKSIILDAIEAYNVKNNLPIKVNGESVILSEYNKIGSKYYDPVNNKLFSVDHLNYTPLDIEPVDNDDKINKLTPSLRGLLDALKEYAKKDYTGNVSVAVYPDNASSDNDSNKFEIIIISDKYNLNNFWTGIWRSKYIYDPSLNNQLTGKIDLNVHYFEGGNVTFNSEKSFKEDNVNLSEILKTIKSFESDFEKQLDVSFNDLNEKKFKTLRRRLPVSRARVNWGSSMGNYRLGKNAAENK